MIKKILLGVLTAILIVSAATYATFSGRYFVQDNYYSVRYYFRLIEAYLAEPACQMGEANLGQCMEKVIAACGGFKYPGQLSFAALFLQKNIPPSKYTVLGNMAIVRSLDPDNFWVAGVKGKTARKQLKDDKKKLIKELSKMKKLAEAAIAKPDPQTFSINEQFIKLLDEKIENLSN